MPLTTVNGMTSNGRRQKLVRSTTSASSASSHEESTENTKSRQKVTKPVVQQQSLGELIICAICLEKLKRPTMLPCQHTFCLLCLQSCMKPNSSLITCPTCRIEVVVPRDGIGALPINIVLQAFLESINKGAGSPILSIRRTQEDSAKILTDTLKNRSCSKCSEPPLSDPCRHCYQVFCKSCHLAHVVDMKKQWAQMVVELAAENERLSLLKEESEARSKKVAENIQAAVGIRVQQLCDKQDQLLAELQIWQKAEVSRLSDIQQLMSDVLVAGSNDDTDMEELFNRAGKILGEARLCSTSSSAGRITFDEEELGLTRQEKMAPLEKAPSTGPADEDPSPLEKVEARRRICSVPLPLTRRVTFNGVFPPPDSRSSMEAVTSPGDRKPLLSPLPETADEQSFVYRSKSGTPKQRLSNLQRPAGVAVSPWTPTELYVVSTDSHRVYVVDRTSGRILKSLGSSYRSGQDGSVTGTFLSPFGIAISVVSEEIYVTDKWLNCIQVFDREGTHVRKIGTKGSSPGHFRSPEGIACDSRTGLIYVADTCNDRIQILDRHGAYLRELGMLSQVTLPGGKLHTKREFNEPTGVTVSPDGARVAVCDSGNCRVKIFNALSGERLIVFGNRGTQRGQFQQPESITMDDKGFVLVGDSGNGRIQIFRQNGSFVRSLGSKGTGPGQFSWISGLIVTRDMEIIASDFKAHAVQVL